MMVKLTAEQVTILGASSPAEATANLSEFFATAATNAKFMTESQITLSDVVKRLEALEKSHVTEARVGELVTAGATTATKNWATSDEGKKIIGAESSRIAMESLAAVGTQPAKPSPASAEPAAATKTFAEIVQGNMDAGKTKSEAISAAIESNPKEYQAYLKTGGKL